MSPLKQKQSPKKRQVIRDKVRQKIHDYKCIHKKKPMEIQQLLLKMENINISKRTIEKTVKPSRSSPFGECKKDITQKIFNKHKVELQNCSSITKFQNLPIGLRKSIRNMVKQNLLEYEYPEKLKLKKDKPKIKVIGSIYKMIMEMVERPNIQYEASWRNEIYIGDLNNPLRMPVQSNTTDIQSQFIGQKYQQQVIEDQNFGEEPKHEEDYHQCDSNLNHFKQETQFQDPEISNQSQQSQQFFETFSNIFLPPMNKTSNTRYSDEQ